MNRLHFLAFGYCHCMCACVSALTQIPKFGEKMQNNCWLRSQFFFIGRGGSDWLWSLSFRGQLTLTFKIKCHLLILKPTLVKYWASVTLTIVTQICDLSWTIAVQCFYCSMNPLRLQELYLLPVLPCCAPTNSILIDLIIPKVLYFLWTTAELCLQGSMLHMHSSDHACMIS